MISNSNSNSNGSKGTPGGGRSRDELITNGNFEDGQTGWAAAPTVTIREGRATIGPPFRPPYAAIAQSILEDGASYDVIIDVVSLPEEGRGSVLDGRSRTVFIFKATGQNSFSFTNSTGSDFSITSDTDALVISNVSVKKQ